MAFRLLRSSSAPGALPVGPKDKETLAFAGCLQWDAGPGGEAKAQWRFFRADIQHEVNMAYSTARSGGGRSVYLLCFEEESVEWRYWLNFKEMTQYADHSGFKRRLRWNEETPMSKKRPADDDWNDCAGDKCLQWDAGSGRPKAKPRWKGFEDKQEEVDAAYSEAQSGGEKEYCLRFDDDWEYILDFANMVQIASHSGYERRLRWWHPKCPE